MRTTLVRQVFLNLSRPLFAEEGGRGNERNQPNFHNPFDLSGWSNNSRRAPSKSSAAEEDQETAASLLPTPSNSPPSSSAAAAEAQNSTEASSFHEIKVCI